MMSSACVLVVAALLSTPITFICEPQALVVSQGDAGISLTQDGARPYGPRNPVLEPQVDEATVGLVPGVRKLKHTWKEQELVLQLTDKGAQLAQGSALKPVKGSFPWSDAQIVGAFAGTFWVIAPARVGIVNPRGRVRSVQFKGPRMLPLVRLAGESLDFFLGDRYRTCDVKLNRCRTQSTLPAPIVDSAWVNKTGLVYVGPAQTGLYFVPWQQPSAAKQILDNKVAMACPVSREALWVLTARNIKEDAFLVSRTNGEAQPHAWATLFAQALAQGQQSNEVSGWLLAQVLRRDLKKATSQALVFATHPHVEVRKATVSAFGQDSSGRSLLALWLLASDPDDEVRMDAVDALHTRCRKDRTLSCEEMMKAASLPGTQDAGWYARDIYMTYVGFEALHDAPLAYLRDLVAKLSWRVEQGVSSKDIKLLAWLAEHPDFEISFAARNMLLMLDPI